MNAEIPPPVSSPANAPAAPVKKRRSLLFYGCGVLLGLVLLICITVAITIWYIQRPIKPVILTEAEQAVVEKKLERLDAANTDQGTRANIAEGPIAVPEPDRPYEPGSKVLRLTERELNGLVNSNTDLGKNVRFNQSHDLAPLLDHCVESVQCTSLH